MKRLCAILALLMMMGCASSGYWSIAVGKDAHARVWQPDRSLQCEDKSDKVGIKTTTETDNKIIGPADVKMTTEPAPPPVISESKGGQVPALAWWSALVCFFSTAC